MAVTVTHATVATGTDAGNGSIHKAEWNANHTLSGTIPVANGGTDAATAILASRNLKTPYILAQSAVSASVGAVTTEQALATITVPAGAVGPNGSVEITASWTCTNGANNKSFYVRVGGVAGSQLYSETKTTINYTSMNKWLHNNNSQTSQKSNAPAFGWPSGWSGNATNSNFTSSVDTSAAWDIVISGQKASAGDTLTLETYCVSIIYGA